MGLPAARRGTGLATAAILCVTLLVACGDDGGDATPTTAPPTSAEPVATTDTTEPADPFAVPDEIDEAYVQRVLDELFRIQGDAFRRAVAEGPDEQVQEWIDSIYTQDEAIRVKNSLLDGFIGQYPTLRRPPGNLMILVDSLGVATSDCVWIEAQRDGTATYVDAGEPAPAFIQLVPSPTNPTGWSIEATRAIGPDGVMPRDRCDS